MKQLDNDKKLIEGEDYYFTPEGYKCFTEKHHLNRGYCCKSGCKHCPYNYESVPEPKRSSLINLANKNSEIK